MWILLSDATGREWWVYRPLILAIPPEEYKKLPMTSILILKTFENKTIRYVPERERVAIKPVAVNFESLAKSLGVTVRTVKRNFKILVDRGYLKKIEDKERGVFYYVSPELVKAAIKMGPKFVV